MEMLKYTINQPHLFFCTYTPQAVALISVLINLAGEMLNVYMLLLQYKVDYVIIHAVALEIIIELPGIYMHSLQSDKLKHRIFDSHQLEVEKRGSEINFWKDRSCLNKL